MAIEKSDLRVMDAVQRWLALRDRKSWPVARQGAFVVSPELVAGIILAVREGGQFACVGACVNQDPFRKLALEGAVDSTASNTAVRTATGRHQMRFVGDPRVLGVVENLPGTVLLVNLGMQAALVFVADAACRDYQVLWSGPVAQLPELDLAGSHVHAGTKTGAPVSSSPVTGRNSPAPQFPKLVPAAVSPHADGVVGPSEPRPTAPGLEFGGQSTSAYARVPSPYPAPSIEPGSSTAAPVSEHKKTARNTAGGLAPAVLSDEVTVILVRHLRHASTQIPTARGADVAREWLAALERACGDIIGDVVGGSMVLFSALHERGHLAVLPSAVSSHAAAQLLVRVTPLVEQVSTRRWALRVSALLDRQSEIFRELAKHAPAACRLASSAPPAPTFARRGRKPGTAAPGDPAKNLLKQQSATTELAAQLTAAHAEIERLQAENAELRLALRRGHD